MRDMGYVVDGRSRVAPRAQAFATLSKKYSVTDAQLVEQTKRNAAKPLFKVDAAKMRLLIDFLSPRAGLPLLTQWLGYSGQNPDRDMATVIAGRSRRISLEEAFKLLCKQYHVTEDELRDHHAVRRRDKWR